MLADASKPRAPLNVKVQDQAPKDDAPKVLNFEVKAGPVKGTDRARDFVSAVQTAASRIPEGLDLLADLDEQDQGRVREAADTLKKINRMLARKGA